MAKKILAVVLAVMMAVSAMAISVAADQQIPLYHDKTASTSNYTLEFTIPVFTQYGWGTQYDGMRIKLPANLGAPFETNDLKYYVTVNGQKFNLKPVKNTPVEATEANGWGYNDGCQVAAVSDEQFIFFGAFVHDYWQDADGTDHWATVPQTQTFGATTSIKIGLDCSGGEWAHTWQIGKGFATDSPNNLYKIPYADAASFLKAEYGKDCYAQFVTYNSETEEYDDVENSVTFLNYWNPTVTGGNTDPVPDTAQAFASGDLSNVIGHVDSNGIFDGDVTVAKPLTWDHNLANRATILGAEADYAELVVETDKPLNGVATYTLYSRSRDNGVYFIEGDDLWWNYESGRTLVDSISINGETSELRFKVPIELLYDSVGYGTYNDEFVIFETIGLFNSTFMDSYYTAKTLSGNAAFLSWDGTKKLDKYTGMSWVNYNGKPINYAAGGTAFPEKRADGSDNDYYNSAVFANKIYLNFPETENSEPANDDEVKTPTEAADGANDPDSGDDMSAGETDNTPAEKNPETGIALAIVPMLVAAAAAVVSKKH